MDKTKSGTKCLLPQTPEQIKNFKKERVSQLHEGVFPLPFHNGSKIILHFIPLEAFNANVRIDVREINEKACALCLIACQTWTYHYNFDGVIVHSAPGEASKCNSYAQVYRNGILEAVASSILNYNQQKLIPGYVYENALMESLGSFLKFAKELGCNMPIAIFLTLTGVKGLRMAPSDERAAGLYGKSEIDRDTLELPEVVIESYDTTPATILRPMFDVVWNACGYERSENFDEDGKWIKR